MRTRLRCGALWLALDLGPCLWTRLRRGHRLLAHGLGRASLPLWPRLTLRTGFLGACPYRLAGLRPRRVQRLGAASHIDAFGCPGTAHRTALLLRKCSRRFNRFHFAHLRARGLCPVWGHRPHIRLSAVRAIQIDPLRASRRGMRTALLDRVPRNRAASQCAWRSSRARIDVPTAAVPPIPVPASVTAISPAAVSVMTAITGTVSPVTPRHIAHGPDRGDIVVQAKTVQPIRRGIDDLAPATIIGVLAHFPFPGPDPDGGDIVVEAVSAEIGNPPVEAERCAPFIGIRVQGHRTIAGAVMALERPMPGRIVAMMAAIVRIGAIARPAKPVGTVTEARIIVSIAAIVR